MQNAYHKMGVFLLTRAIESAIIYPNQLAKCISNFDLSVTSRRCLRRSFRPPFSKGGADPTRGALVASAEAKLLLRHFFFAKLFSLGRRCQRKKRTYSLFLPYCIRGTPHLCGSPLPSLSSAFTLRWRFGRIKEFRSLRRATNAPRVGSAVAF